MTIIASADRVIIDLGGCLSTIKHHVHSEAKYYLPPTKSIWTNLNDYCNRKYVLLSTMSSLRQRTP